MLPLVQNFRTVILANGEFPKHSVALSFLDNAERIICCDGATQSLLNYGLKPTMIVGDLDSLTDELAERFSDRLLKENEQESNDLTKAVNYCVSMGFKDITILGATGKREDHTLGNISLLADYTDMANVQMITDYGVFNAIRQTTEFESFVGQQISIFCVEQLVKISTIKLKYPLPNKAIPAWWMGTLNEALEDTFGLEFSKGKFMVFRQHRSN
ncbi:MAG: thiamine diphosphokinase [Prevotellaceae bacterium]|nr:thiamine diphosphokinase [Prevotellaceae bacterium]